MHKAPDKRSVASPLSPGDRVEVYQYPLTDEQPEGIATLVRSIGADPVAGVEYWMVRFDGEAEEYERWVHPRHRKG